MEKYINKVVINKEAKFDFEEVCCCYKMPKAEMKRELEIYIDLMQNSGRLLYKKIFKVKYLDEVTDKMLLLFFRKGRCLRLMQFYELEGICEETNYSEDLEDEGLIRNWLKHKFNF